MKKILLDTNIILDLLFQREGFYKNALDISTMIEEKEFDGYICATTVTTIYYLFAKKFDKEHTDMVIDKLIKLYKFTDINKQVLIESFENRGKDFEDSVIFTSAKFANIDIIITRDKTGFKNSKVLIMEPKEFLAIYKTK